jgi:hypothetical protein
MSEMVDEVVDAPDNTNAEATEETTEVNTEATEQAAEETTEESESGAPEAYTDFTMEEGAALNETVLGDFKETAKDLGLSQEGAQKLVDLGMKLTEQNAAAQQESWDKTRDGWVEQIKSDTEYGGDKFDATLERANRALRQYGSEGLIQFLGDTGYGDNPELIKMFAKIDTATGEDKSIDGSPANTDGRSLADVMYPNQ